MTLDPCPKKSLAIGVAFKNYSGDIRLGKRERVVYWTVRGIISDKGTDKHTTGRVRDVLHSQRRLFVCGFLFVRVSFTYLLSRWHAGHLSKPLISQIKQWNWLVQIMSRTLATEVLYKGPYYMASSASGQDEPNCALWLATRAGKMEPSCPLGTTCCISQEKFPQKPYNKSFFCEFMDLDFVSVH